MNLGWRFEYYLLCVAKGEKLDQFRLQPSSKKLFTFLQIPLPLKYLTLKGVAEYLCVET